MQRSWTELNNIYLFTKGRHRISGGIKEHTVVVQMEQMIFQSEQGISLNIWNWKVAFGYGEELPHNG